MELSMAALRIRSAADIVGAYLQTMGYEKQQTVSAFEQLLSCRGAFAEGDDVVALLDDLVFKAAQKVFRGYGADRIGKIALFKYCFCRAKAAEKFGPDAWCGSEPTTALKEVLQKETVFVAPPYSLSHMQPQKIESPAPGRCLGKLFHPHQKVLKK